MKRSDIVHMEYNGENLSIGQWSERLGIPAATIHTRFNRGLTPGQCLGLEPMPPKEVAPLPNLLTEFIPLDLVPVPWDGGKINHEAIGRVARGIRTTAGKTIIQAAAELGMSFQSLSALERGGRQWLQSHVDAFNSAAQRWHEEAVEV